MHVLMNEADNYGENTFITDFCGHCEHETMIFIYLNPEKTLLNCPLIDLPIIAGMCIVMKIWAGLDSQWISPKLTTSQIQYLSRKLRYYIPKEWQNGQGIIYGLIPIIR